MDHIPSHVNSVAPGDSCRLAGRVWSVEALLGRGSEGHVWRVRSAHGEAQAWKLFHPQGADDLRRDHLLWLIDQPRPSRHFLWPTAITAGEYGLGYLMPLRPAGSAPLKRLLRGAVRVDDRLAQQCAGELAGEVAGLHAAGLVFRDLSVGNVFVDVDTGDIAVCDVDNTARDGRSVPRVRGTPGFIAPEVAAGTARAGRSSDLYALAVLVIAVLNRMMPVSSSTPAELTNSWPTQVVELADRALGPGASDPTARPEAIEWKLALAIET